MIPLIIYLLLINAAGFVLMLLDKHKARKKKWRIPETTLMSVAAIGGSIGVIAGMYLARHKTLHSKFSLGVPLILAGQIVFAVILYAKIGR